MYKKSYFLYLTLFVLLLVSCGKDDETVQSGTIQFSFSKSSEQTGRVESAEVSHILVSIVEEDNSTIYYREEISLVRFGDDYLSDPLSLSPGSYKVTEYLVVDNSGKVVYAAPLKGSALAHLVSNPLPVSFSVNSDETTKVSIEVVSTDAGSGEDFGYATFTLEVIDYVQFQLGVFVYDITTNNYELTEASLELFVDGTMVLETLIGDSTNTITAPIGEEYLLVISKDSYTSKSTTLTLSDLHSYAIDPLEIILNDGEVSTLILKPDATAGKDAGLWTEEPDLNYANTTAFYALAWTWNGDGYGAGEWRNLIEFDMSSVPVEKEILEATLKLSFFEASYFADLYHQFKTNEAKLQRVVQPWDETTVTWNTQPNVSLDNEVLIPSTTDDPYIDYEIDVTQLVKDQRVYGNYGFLFSLQKSDYYRGVIMASSDHSDPNLHPVLEIVYRD